MPAWVVILVIVVGSAHLLAYYGGRRGLAGVLKALPILALAGTAATIAPSVGTLYAMLITVGLLCSAVGDVCLVWPERFTMGLASFLVAHLCYVAAFASGGLGAMAWPWLVVISMIAAGLLRVLWPHLGQVRWAVLLYVTVIALMAWTAARRAALPATPASSGTLALAGALVVHGVRRGARLRPVRAPLPSRLRGGDGDVLRGADAHRVVRGRFRLTAAPDPGFLGGCEPRIPTSPWHSCALRSARRTPPPTSAGREPRR